MGRGFLSGAIWGALVSVVLMTVGLYMGGVVDLSLPVPKTETVEVPPGSEFARGRPESDPVLPQADARPASATAALRALEPSGAAPPPPPRPDTPTAAPDAPSVDDTGMAAPEQSQIVVLAPGAEQPVQPGSSARAPSVPADEAVLQPIETPAPGGADISAAPVPDTTEPPQTAAPTLDDGAPQAPAGRTDTPVAGATAAVAPPAPLVGQELVPQSLGQASAEAPVLAAVPSAPAAPSAPASDATPPQPAVQAGPTEPRGNGPVALTQSIDGIRLPVPEIAEIRPGVEIGSPPVAPDAPPQPAIDRYALPFDWDGEAPLLAVLLIDNGADSTNPGDIVAFPVPVTIALDPMQFEAVASAPTYRAAGAEIALLAPLAETAEPADVEVSFQIFLKAVPESVAVVDMPDGRLQRDRPRASQVVAILSETGHGLVSYDRGLNSILQIAGQQGVPAATVFRVFDDGVRGVAAMKRFLDRAAFQAGIDGVTIVTGSTRPETLTAIAEWSLSNRAATVTLAPLSAALRAAARN